MNNTNRIDYDANHFFDSFTAFYDTSKTGNSPNRLNNRYIAMIHSNKEIIRNSSVLDLASHDGRWTLAAIKNRAKKVLGIEGREELVTKSFENMKKYGISSEKYSFVAGDIFEKMRELKPKDYDVVFCLGIFYHIMNHMQLLREIKRLQPRYIILDTDISLSEQPVIFIRKENSLIEANAIPDSLNAGNDIIVGRPSKSALDLMLNSIGFDFDYYDWENAGIKNWEFLEEYRLKQRFQFKRALRYGPTVMRDFKNKRKDIGERVRNFQDRRRITLVAKNRFFS